MATNRKTPIGWPYKAARRLRRIDEYGQTAAHELEKLCKTALSRLTDEERFSLINARLHTEMLLKEVLKAQQSIEEPTDE